MKAVSLGLVAGFIAFSIDAQKSQVKFGEIPHEDLKMVSYQPDSSVSA